MTERDRLINVFRQDSTGSYNIWPVTTDLYNTAGDLCRSHRLRAYDAVQLACALALREYTQINQAPPPIFVCADVVLWMLQVLRDYRLKIQTPIREHRGTVTL